MTIDTKTGILESKVGPSTYNTASIRVMKGECKREKKGKCICYKELEKVVRSRGDTED